MKPPSVSSGREQVPVSSTSQLTLLPPQESEPLARKAAHGQLLRALTTLSERAGFPPLVIASPAMLDLILTIDRARDSRAPVLIMGETGTGKELIARAVHALSNRQGRAFIPFNCAAATRELIESQLFGHRRGSFTGATSDFIGIIREADGGTLLLDEIGELPLDVQPKLLRFLQEGEVHPVGATKPVKTDVRVAAATNRDLEAEVRAGRFREDLFERLNVLRLPLPPLRERREEIPILIAYFLDRYQKEEHRQGLRLSEEAMTSLLQYDWPRNVRQLGNEIRRLVVRAENDDVIGVESLSPEIGTRADVPLVSGAMIVRDKIVVPLGLPYHEAKDELERLSIIRALEETGGNLTQAALRLGMSRLGFRKAMSRHGIQVERDEIYKSRQ